MKKWTHLYVFAVLSGIASLFRVYGAFFSSFDEATLRASLEGQSAPDSVVDQTIAVLRASSEFSTNIPNKLLAVVLLLTLIGTIYLLFKKQNEQASYLYIGYLFGTLVQATYAFIGSKGIAALYTDEIMRQATSASGLFAYGVTIFLFAIYFGLTLFFLLRKPKVSLEQTATDI